MQRSSISIINNRLLSVASTKSLDVWIFATGHRFNISVPQEPCGPLVYLHVYPSAVVCCLKLLVRPVQIQPCPIVRIFQPTVLLRN